MQPPHWAPPGRQVKPAPGHGRKILQQIPVLPAASIEANHLEPSLVPIVCPHRPEPLQAAALVLKKSGCGWGTKQLSLGLISTVQVRGMLQARCAARCPLACGFSAPWYCWGNSSETTKANGAAGAFGDWQMLTSQLGRAGGHVETPLNPCHHPRCATPAAAPAVAAACATAAVVIVLLVIGFFWVVWTNRRSEGSIVWPWQRRRRQEDAEEAAAAAAAALAAAAAAAAPKLAAAGPHQAAQPRTIAVVVMQPDNTAHVGITASPPGDIEAGGGLRSSSGGLSSSALSAPGGCCCTGLNTSACPPPLLWSCLI